MKECCETDVAHKKKYWHWIALGFVLVLALALQMIPVRNHSGSVSVKAKMDIVVIRGALDEYALNNKGAYPSSLQPLVTPDTNGKAYLEGYNGIVPKDPWGHEYRYDPPTADHPRPRVWSFGADGKVGGSGADKDIYSDS